MGEFTELELKLMRPVVARLRVPLHERVPLPNGSSEVAVAQAWATGDAGGLPFKVSPGFGGNLEIHVGSSAGPAGSYRRYFIDVRELMEVVTGFYLDELQRAKEGTDGRK